MMETSSKAHKEFSSNLTSQVIAPTNEWWKRNDKLASTLSGLHRKQAGGLQAKLEKLKKDDKQCAVSFVSAKSDGSGGSGDKSHTKAVDLFRKHYESVDALRNEQNIYALQHLPSTLGTLL
jgi:hypothetical protein